MYSQKYKNAQISLASPRYFAPITRSPSLSLFFIDLVCLPGLKQPILIRYNCRLIIIIKFTATHDTLPKTTNYANVKLRDGHQAIN